MLKKENISPQRAADMVEEGMTIMIGGFWRLGRQKKLLMRWWKKAWVI